MTNDKTAETPPETLIEFPARLAVKAMGLNEDDFESLITTLVMPLVESCDARVSTVASKEGKYLSVRVHFTATCHDHLKSVYVALRSEPRVLYTL